MADRSNFAAETASFRSSLYATAMRLTANRYDAEDLVQETYLRAYRSYGTFTSGTNVRAWLFRILKNANINLHRARTRRPDEAPLADHDGGPHPSSDAHGRSAEDELLDDLSESEVMAAVEALSPAYRRTVLLADVDGFSYREVAAILGIPIGTVMSRLHRGRRLLRDSLAEYVTSPRLLPVLP